MAVEGFWCPGVPQNPEERTQPPELLNYRVPPRYRRTPTYPTPTPMAPVL